MPLPKRVAVTLTAEKYGKIASGHYTLPTGVSIREITPDGTGANVTVTFSGDVLGAWAVPPAVAGEVGHDASNVLIIQPAGGGSSSSSGL